MKNTLSLAYAGALALVLSACTTVPPTNVHQPMTAVPPDLRYIGTFAAKVAVATLLESHHGDHTQQVPGEHAIIGLRPAGDLAVPFDLSQAGDVRWSSIPRPRTSCPTCSPG